MMQILMEKNCLLHFSIDYIPEMVKETAGDVKIKSG